MVTEFANPSKNSASSFDTESRAAGGFDNAEKQGAATFAEAPTHIESYENPPKTRLLWGDIPIEEVADYTFKSVVLVDGTTVENVTFETLVDIIWRNQSRN